MEEKLPAGALATAEQILRDNGVKPDLAPAVMRAIGYALFDTDLYPGDPANTRVTNLYLCYVSAGAGKDDFHNAPVVRDPLVTADVNEALAWYRRHMKEANRKYPSQPYPWYSDDDLVAEMFDRGIGRHFTDHKSRLCELIRVMEWPMRVSLNNVVVTMASIEEREFDKEEPSSFTPVEDMQLFSDNPSLKLWLNTVHKRMRADNYFLAPESKKLFETGMDWWGQNISFTYTNSPSGINASCLRMLRLLPFEIHFPERYHEGDLLICKPPEDKREPSTIDHEVYSVVMDVSQSGETVVLQRYAKQGRLKMSTVSLPAWQVRRYYQKMNEAEEAEFKKNTEKEK